MSWSIHRMILEITHSGTCVQVASLLLFATSCSSMSEAWSGITGRNLNNDAAKNAAHDGDSPIKDESQALPPTCDFVGIAQPRLTDRSSLAVIDFHVENSLGPTTGRGLADICRSSIQESGLFILLDREDMLTILGEEDFATAIKCDDSKCLVDYGKKLRAQKMVHGRVSQVGNAIVLSIKLTDVGTGKVESFKTAQVRGSPDELLKWVPPQTCLMLREAASTKQ